MKAYVFALLLLGWIAAAVASGPGMVEVIPTTSYRANEHKTKKKSSPTKSAPTKSANKSTNQSFDASSVAAPLVGAVGAGLAAKAASSQDQSFLKSQSGNLQKKLKELQQKQKDLAFFSNQLQAAKFKNMELGNGNLSVSKLFYMGVYLFALFFVLQTHFAPLLG